MSNIFRDMFVERPVRSWFIVAFVFVWSCGLVWLSGDFFAFPLSVLNLLAPGIFFGILFSLFFIGRFSENLVRIMRAMHLFVFWYLLAHFAVFGFLGVFAFYQNEIAPATLPKITISNGEKTIVFRTMSHVATDAFYRGVQNDIDAAKREGFWYYYEWVRPGSSASAEEFDRLLGIRFGADIYAELGRTAGLVPQTDYEFIGRVNDQDLNVDLDMDTIVERIRERLPTASLSGTVSEPMDFSTLSAQLDRASENQRRVIAYLNRTLLNFFTKIQSIVPLTAVDPTLADVFSVVLGERDEHVARALVQSQEKRIFLTYGLLHFDGIYARLKREDPDYAIIKIEPYYPFVSE